MDYAINPFDAISDAWRYGRRQKRPAATEVAVTSALPPAEPPDAGMPNYPTQFRAGYEAGNARPAASTLMDKPKSVAVPQRDTSPYPSFTPYSEGPGTRAASPAFPTIQFNAPPAPVANATSQVGGVGLIPPQVQYQLSELYDEAKPLLSSAGIVDRLRGRQLMRARARLLDGAVQIAGARTQGVNAESGMLGAQAGMLGAQTGAYRASNEVPLALLGSATQRYGYDSSANTALTTQRMQSDTTRYVNDQNNATAVRGQDAEVARHLPSIQRNALINRAIEMGDMEYAHELATLGSRDPRPNAPRFEKILGTTGEQLVKIDSEGNTSLVDLPTLQAEADARKKKKLQDARTGY